MTAYNYEGGIEMVKSLLQDPPLEPHPQEPHPQGTTDVPWCIWLTCCPKDTAEENICCRRNPCITDMAWFDTVVLNRDVLTFAIWAWSDITADLSSYSPSSYRKVVYRQYVIWKYGTWGGTITKFSLPLLSYVSDESIQLQMVIT